MVKISSILNLSMFETRPVSYNFRAYASSHYNASSQQSYHLCNPRRKSLLFYTIFSLQKSLTFLFECVLAAIIVSPYPPLANIQ